MIKFHTTLTNLLTIFQIVDDSDTDDNNKLPVGSSHSTTLEPPCDRGGQLIDDIITIDVTCAHNNGTMPVADNNNTQPSLLVTTMLTQNLLLVTVMQVIWQDYHRKLVGGQMHRTSKKLLSIAYLTTTCML